MAIGGSASPDNDPRKDGDDGTSFISPDGEMYLEPLKGKTIKSKERVDITREPKTAYQLHVNLFY